MNLKDIRLNPDNPRFIKDDKFKKLCQSIKEFPKMLELRPIIVDSTGLILGGNMRFRAITQLGLELKDEWFKEASSLTDEEKRRFIVEDNVGFGEWDWDKLSAEFEKEELEDWGLDIDKWKEDEVIEDEVPEVTENPVSKLGEVYQLGRHRIMCGDSTKIEDVEKLMDGKKADMVFTDPPYGVSLDKTLGGDKDNYDELQNDDLSSNDLLYFNRLWLKNIFDSLKDWGVCYVFYSSNKVIEIRTSASELFKIKDTIIWVKDNFVLGRNDYKPQYEPILYLEKLGSGKVNRIWNGNFNQSNVWELNRDKSLKEHPTQKPVSLCAKGLANSSNENNIVLDLFLGSGSTLIACEQNNRTCYGMEIDPKYIDVIRKRYAKFIGKEEEWEKITPVLK